MGKSGKQFRERNKRQDRRQKADAKRRWLVDTNKQDRRAA